MYSLKNCLDNHYCPETIILHCDEISKEEFFEQVVSCVNEIEKEPLSCDHAVRNLFAKLLEKSRPVDFEHVLEKMCEKYGYQKITAAKHSYALWQNKSKIIKNVNEHHTTYFRNVDREHLTTRFLGSAGSGGFWANDYD